MIRARPLHMPTHYFRSGSVLRRLRPLAVKILPLQLCKALWVELRITGVRWRSRNRAQEYQGKRDLLVNLGAGDAGKEGWVNVDAFPLPGVNCLYDCRKSLPFPDDSVAFIFTEHFLEHIDYDEDVPTFLSECHRVLSPGGVIRVVVPDAEEYVRAYCADGWDALRAVRGLHPDRSDPWTGRKYVTKMELINHIFRQGLDHRFAYDYETLAWLLSRSGFAEIHRQEFGQSLMPQCALDQPVRASESLYVEAVKPSLG